LLERHRALLGVLGQDRVTLTGGSGAGYLARLLASLLWFGQAVAASCASRSRQQVASRFAG